jgi:small conductance mechanosensitive channel
LIAVSRLAANRVDRVMRPGTDTADNWPVDFDTVETIKWRFDQAGITIPYRRRDVHRYLQRTA